MDKNRRNFLKVAGISTLAGLGGTAVVDRLVGGASLLKPLPKPGIMSIRPRPRKDMASNKIRA